jgi:hypothetical protein
MGLQLASGNGIPKDAGTGARALEKACNLNDLDGCSYLAGLYERGEGVGRNVEKAINIHRRVCEAGAAIGCNALGYVYYLGKGGTPKSIPRAMSLFKQACDLDPRAGCDSLGDIYALGGDGVTKDDTQAVALYKKGCDGGNPGACLELGFMQYAGKGTMKNEALAVDTFKKNRHGLADADGTCADGVSRLCTVSGVVRSKLGMPDADRYLQRGCELGDLFACDERQRRGR